MEMILQKNKPKTQLLKSNDNYLKTFFTYGIISIVFIVYESGEKIKDIFEG